MAKTCLTMIRHGDFRAVIKGYTHCGRDMGNASVRFQYYVVVECVPIVDQRGFLFDQVAIDHVFQRVRETELSCENLAMDCFREVLAAIQQENPTIIIRKMKIDISAEPHPATMTYMQKWPLGKPE